MSDPEFDQAIAIAQAYVRVGGSSVALNQSLIAKVNRVLSVCTMPQGDFPQQQQEADITMSSSSTEQQSEWLKKQSLSNDDYFDSLDAFSMQDASSSYEPLGDQTKTTIPEDVTYVSHHMNSLSLWNPLLQFKIIINDHFHCWL